ncbi:hypothetical protein M0812_29845 [Anaeramoeba flamelloides]|uniref:Uncharacterized protein n=1 Tax=Anaeramoeba flamelloides TaxID=1746091 RepID=A0AAV7Y7R9_9EUKA|nr:hypothetical protein M0812_29845 [Anaeramoeba flamelloides]
MGVSRCRFFSTLKRYIVFQIESLESNQITFQGILATFETCFPANHLLLIEKLTGQNFHLSFQIKIRNNKCIKANGATITAHNPLLQVQKKKKKNIRRNPKTIMDDEFKIKNSIDRTSTPSKIRRVQDRTIYKAKFNFPDINNY